MDNRESNYKVIIFFFIILFLSGLFYYFDLKQNQPEVIEPISTVSKIPFKALAEALFSIAVIGIAYEWWIRKENENYLKSTISKIIEESNNRQKKSIIESIFLDPNLLQHISSDKQDELVKSSLQVILDNEQMGEELFETLISKVIANRQRQYNYRKEIIFEDLKEDPDKRLFRTTIDLSVEKELKTNEFRFYFVNQDNFYQELLYTHSIENVFQYNQYKFIKSSNFFDYFNIEDFSVDGINLNIENQINQNNFCIVCSHPDLYKSIGKKVNIYYRRNVLVDKLGHCYAVNIGRPTRNLTVGFDFHKTNIAHVSVSDFFITDKHPKYIRTPKNKETRKIEVNLLGWAFPMSGINYTWCLENEFK